MEMMDARLAVIDRRLENVKKIIAVSGGKGGVGKSLTASIMALIFSKKGYKTGLLDLDFCGPSTHTILGIERDLPAEEKGIIPPNPLGFKFMSIIYYAGDNPNPLRGIDISNAIIELLSITRWGALDFLVIDMPPGIGDTTMEVIRLLKRANFLLITTESKVAFSVLEKLISMLKELNVSIIGVIENMKLTSSTIYMEKISQRNVHFLGEIDFERELDDAIGNTDKLLKSRFARRLRDILEREEFKLEDESL